MYSESEENLMRENPAKRRQYETLSFYARRGKRTLANFDCERIIKGHTCTVAALIVWNNQLYSGSTDSDIKVWNFSGECIGCYEGLSWSVCLQHHHGRLYSGGEDGTLVALDPTLQIAKNLPGHSDGIWCLESFNGYLYSGSGDESIRAWDDEGNCVAVLEEHTDAVKSLKHWKGSLYTGSRDSTIKVWDKENHCISTLEGHSQGILCLEVFNDMICSGSIDTTIRGWDTTGKCQTILQGHTNAVVCLQALDFTLYSGSYDGTIRAWDKIGNCLEIFLGHSDEVWSLAASNGYLYSGSADHTIRCWNVGGPKSLFKQCLRLICEQMSTFESQFSMLPNDLIEKIQSHINPVPLLTSKETKRSKVAPQSYEQALSIK